MQSPTREKMNASFEEDSAGEVFASFISVHDLPHNFGGDKDIGSFASLCLLVNIIVGPAIVSLAVVFAKAGLVASVLTVFLISGLSLVSSKMMAEAMQHVPGNQNFRSRVEYTSVVRFFLGSRWFTLSVLLMNGAFLCINVTSIIQGAQVADTAFESLLGSTCGVRVYPEPFLFLCRSNTDLPDAYYCEQFDSRPKSCVSDGALGCNWGPGSAFGFTAPGQRDLTGCYPDPSTSWGHRFRPIVITAGCVFTAILTLPLSFLNLDDNSVVQIVSFVLTAIIMVVWLLAFVAKLDTEWESYHFEDFFPVGGQSGSLWPLIGVLLFNWGLAKFLPSWVNEKERGVPVYGKLNQAFAVALGANVLIGFVGAFAFGKEFRQGKRSDIIHALSQAHTLPRSLLWMARISAYAFPLISNLPSIPIFAIVIRYNLVEMGAPTALATFIGVYLPWLVAIPFLVWSDAFINIMSIGALCVVSVVDFLLPMLVWIRLQEWLSSEQSHPSLAGLLRNRTREGPLENTGTTWLSPGLAKMMMWTTVGVVLGSIVCTVIL